MLHTDLIAEIGLNFAYGTKQENFLSNAKNLIVQAKLAGFDYVKFQKRTPEICVPEEQKTKIKFVPWREEETTYLQYKKDIELSVEQYKELKHFADENGIKLFASVWDKPSVDAMKEVAGNDIFIAKIPSALITDIELCKYAREKADILMLSTGMSTEDEIEKAIRESNPDIIFHTCSAYPSDLEDLHLNYITHLKEKYPDKKIGYSGHEFGIDTTIAAVAMGAEIVERHITLNRNDWGSDQKASVEPVGMFKLVKGIRELEIAMGDKINERQISQSELKKRESLRK